MARYTHRASPTLSPRSPPSHSLLLLLLSLGAASLAIQGDADPVYIVRLKDPPVTAYTGEIGGYPATAPVATASPAAGTVTTLNKLGNAARNAAKQLWKKRPRLNVRSANVKSFVKFLKQQQTKVAQDLGLAVGNLIHSYTHVENGFAAALSPKQVRRLQSHSDVAAVTQSVRVAPSTTHSRGFLRLEQSLWQSAGGQMVAGEGVVIGVIDSGIWPEHVSFANSDEDWYDAPPDSFKGVCETTSDFPACNGKLVGARYINAAFAKENKGKVNFTYDFNSPRDVDGHGTWCAGAAAGNSGVYVDGSVASGMAPRARLAVYKVFWHGKSGNMWASKADVLAALNLAVADGVDVLSLSFGVVNSRATYFDDIPFLNALAAGVVVSYAAGNAGSVHPRKGEYRLIDNFAPWYLTVGASRYTDMFGGDPNAPASTSAAAITPQSVDSATGDDTGDSSGSGSGDTGGSVRTMSVGAGAAAVALSSTELKGITILESPDSPDEAPLLAKFSSTGPLIAPAAVPGAGKPTNDILKPDIIGPGVQLWAAAPDPSLTTSDYNYFNRLSGTSMATPHIAGIVALIMQQKPTWSPAQIMSAIMTTATATNNRGSPIRTMAKNETTPMGDRVATPWEMGAGHVNPTTVLDPGLTYDANATEFKNFLGGLNFNQAKKEFRAMTVKPIRACNLNRASISVSKMQRSVTVTRRVTNVAVETSTYVSSVAIPSGVGVVVNPPSFTIQPDQTVTYTVTFSVQKKNPDFVYGSLTWKDDKGHVVRSPIAVQPLK